MICVYLFIEELFIDYGLSYDRSGYASSSDPTTTDSPTTTLTPEEQSLAQAKAADLDRRMKAMAKIQEELDQLTLQPVTQKDSNNDMFSRDKEVSDKSSKKPVIGMYEAYIKVAKCAYTRYVACILYTRYCMYCLPCITLTAATDIHTVYYSNHTVYSYIIYYICIQIKTLL